ncbi:MAG: BREX system Lon protease-like protein BrxL [Limisphaerales bacterium]
MTPLSAKLNQVFPGRVVRKDLVQRVKKGTNVPTFVLEFLLARYCATDDLDEIEAGLQAVNETIQGNFVRPNESNAAQSLVQRNGNHKFIDKVRVVHKESEKRHWAEMENFGSKRIAINERHYRENQRLLEGGLWCEATIGYNTVEEDDYTFHVEEIRPIQISRFDFEAFVAGREQFTRDEWLDALLATIGLEPSKITPRQKLHYLTRLVPLVEQNYNLIELGPPGTGKSYAFSEFSPYATLISGGQTSTAILFFNKVRRQVGIIGYWDVVAFDEVGGMRIKDPGTVQILKDYMANGRFSLGTEVTAPASLAFMGNIYDSISAVVAHPKQDLFKPLPPEFDIAVIHRFHNFIPGWELPPNSSSLLTDEYGFITDYMAEALHYLNKHRNFYTTVKKRAQLGDGFQGRDETAVYKTVAAFLKLLHPSGECSDAEFDEYVAYAIEGRRRVKEQLNKRKQDDDFAQIHLGYRNHAGDLVEVHCPESRGVSATLDPRRNSPVTISAPCPAPSASAPPPSVALAIPVEPPAASTVPAPAAADLVEKHITIRYGDTGYSYEALFGAYLGGAKELTVEDPYIRRDHQLRNFIQLCELCVQVGTIKKIALVTGTDHDYQKTEVEPKFQSLAESLADAGVEFAWRFDDKIHDRELRTDTGWHIRIGRGLDIYQRTETWIQIGASNLNVRPCMETKVSIFRASTA